MPSVPSRRVRLSLILVLAILAAAAAAYAWWRYSHADALPPGFAHANGRLELTRIDVAAKYPGRLMSVSFEEGDRVQAGQVLGIQEDDELQARLAQARATQARAGAEQARANAGEQAQMRKVALARIDWEQARILLTQQQIAPVELQRRQLALDAESASERAAGEAADAAGHAVAEAEAQVALVQSMIDALQLRAPITGRIEYRISERGTVLPPGGRLATMLDTDDAYLTVFYPAEIASRLRVGDEARIVLEGSGGQALPAVIGMVDDEAQFTPKYVETTTERQNLVYRVKLRIPRQVSQRLEGQLKGGITGDGYVRTSNQPWPLALQVKASQ